MQKTSWEQIVKADRLYTRLAELPCDAQILLKTIFNAYLDGYEIATGTTKISKEDTQ